MKTHRIFTIPNLLSFLRLLMIPVFVWAYIGKRSAPATALVLALSGLTDMLDGRIARRFNQVSDFGKMLDPIADKLTQGGNADLPCDALSGDVDTAYSACRQGNLRRNHEPDRHSEIRPCGWRGAAWEDRDMLPVRTYETLLNTDVKLEQENIANLMRMAVDYGCSIGFTGDFLIAPKPKEPMKHQHDFDAETAIGFLRQYGPDKDFKLNIEANHATLAGHTFQHELRISAINGSIDANQGDTLLEQVMNEVLFRQTLSMQPASGFSPWSDTGDGPTVKWPRATLIQAPWVCDQSKWLMPKRDRRDFLWNSQ